MKVYIFGTEMSHKIRFFKCKKSHFWYLLKLGEKRKKKKKHS